MVAINNSSLRQNVYETVYDLLKAEQGSYGASSSVTVTAAYIDKEEAFPQVIVNPVMVAKSDYTFSRTSDNSLKDITVVIDVYTKKSKDLDIITDYVDNILSTASINGLMLFDADESMAISTIEGNKIRSKSLTYTYRRR